MKYVQMFGKRMFPFNTLSPSVPSSHILAPAAPSVIPVDIETWIEQKSSELITGYCLGRKQFATLVEDGKWSAKVRKHALPECRVDMERAGALQGT